MQKHLQNKFLNNIRKDNINISIFLVNWIKLEINIKSFDSYIILLRSKLTQCVYNHAISTIVPTQVVKLEIDD